MINIIKSKLRPYRWLYHMLSKKKMQPEELWSGRFSFSQFGEDLILNNIFTRNNIRNGFYIEVGAYDPFVYSNTYFMYKIGWSGICIEPNPEAFNKLKLKREKDIVLNIAVSNFSGDVPFVVEKACSGILDDNYIFKNNQVKKRLTVPCRPLAKILDEYACNKEINFMSVDCEGHDLVVLESNNWVKYRPQIIIAEDHNPKYSGPIFDYMTSKGYEFICKVGPSIFFRESSFHLKVH